jgi:hypothetical protein
MNQTFSPTWILSMALLDSTILELQRRSPKFPGVINTPCWKLSATDGSAANSADDLARSLRVGTLGSPSEHPGAGKESGGRFIMVSAACAGQSTGVVEK